MPTDDQLWQESSQIAQQNVDEILTTLRREVRELGQADEPLVERAAVLQILDELSRRFGVNDE